MGKARAPPALLPPRRREGLQVRLQRPHAVHQPPRLHDHQRDAACQRLPQHPHAPGLLQHVHKPPRMRIMGVLRHQDLRAEARRTEVRRATVGRLRDVVWLPRWRNVLILYAYANTYTTHTTHTHTHTHT